MPTSVKKARRAAGVKFTKAQKTPTPLAQRAFVDSDVMRRPSDAMPAGWRRSILAPRSPRRIAKFILSGGTSR
jgi:hypothetical protein